MLKFRHNQISSGVLLITLLNIPDSVGMEISATDTGRTTLSRSWTSNYSKNSTVIITLYPASDKTNAYNTVRDENSSYNCPAVTVEEYKLTVTPYRAYVKKGTCKFVSSNFEVHMGNFQVDATLSNTTSSDQTIYMHIHMWGSGWSEIQSGSTIRGVVPAKATCSASISNLALGNFVAGTTVDKKTLPVFVSGLASNKSLIISGSDIKSDGKLNLGGSSSGVKVYPESSYISGSTWNVGSASKVINLTVDASNGKVGTWTSSLLATLTCS